jgi:hypothetical protein
VLEEAQYYTRLMGGVWDYMRAPREADPLAAVRERVQRRDQAFLYLAREAAYGRPESSLYKLLRLAGCAYADLEATVRGKGLEAALEQLAAGGVYLTHDELKGKVPLVRHGQEVPAGERRFRNPLAPGGMEGRSSGSRSGGRGTPTPRTTAFQAYRDAHETIWAHEYGLQDAEWLQVRPILPSMTGLSGVIRATRQGRPMGRWFTVPSTMRDAGHYRMVTSVMVAVGRLAGGSVPFPQALPANDFSPVARYIAGRKCAVLAFASPAVRVADAALRAGLDLSQVTFISGGEASTPAKRAVVARAGARLFTNYHISEVGPIGSACRHMQSGNEVHVVADSVAVVKRRRPLPFGEGSEIDALLFTTLLPFAPRFLINAEMDDTGVITRDVRCDCTYGRLGMTTVISRIASFGKVTGQGMTLHGADIAAILEQALPGRFGGGPGDYQIVERDLGTQTMVELRVSPRAVAADADLDAMLAFFLDQMRQYYGGTVAARIWQHAGAIQVVRQEPETTYTGKVLPLALLGSGTPSGSSR